MSRGLGIVPARGGSKGLPGKNLTDLCGLPLIGWTLRTAGEATHLERCVVSTDDPEIARVARELGGEVPFLRPAELATDEASIVGAIQHAVNWFERETERRIEIAVILQPTSPLRIAADIDEAIELFEKTGCDSVETVRLDEEHPDHLTRIDEEGRLTPVFEETATTWRRQDGPAWFRPTGSVYVVGRDMLMERGRIRGEDHRGLPRGSEVSVDIDSAADLALARWYLEKRSR